MLRDSGNWTAWCSLCNCFWRPPPPPAPPPTALLVPNFQRLFFLFFFLSFVCFVSLPWRSARGRRRGRRRRRRKGAAAIWWWERGGLQDELFFSRLSKTSSRYCFSWQETEKSSFFLVPLRKVSNVYWFLCFCVSRFSSSSEQLVVERDDFIILFYFRPSGLCFLLDCGFAWCIERFADFHLSRINCVANSWDNSHIQGDWCECFVHVFDEMITISQVNFGNWSSNQAAVLVRLCSSWWVSRQLRYFRSSRLLLSVGEREEFFSRKKYESLAVHVQCSKQVLATEAIILFCSRNWDHPGLRLLYVVHCSLSLGRGLSAV